MGLLCGQKAAVLIFQAEPETGPVYLMLWRGGRLQINLKSPLQFGKIFCIILLEPQGRAHFPPSQET